MPAFLSLEEVGGTRLVKIRKRENVKAQLEVTTRLCGQPPLQRDETVQYC